MNLDVILNKNESIQRCLQQVREYYNTPTGKSFQDDYYRQDAIAMNLQRMAELAIDIANYVVNQKKLGIPKSSSDSFMMLRQAGIIDQPLADKMKGMVGFRNILVHDYVELDIKIMVDVIENHLEDVIDFSTKMLAYGRDNP